MVSILGAIFKAHIRDEKLGPRRLDGDLHPDEGLDVIEVRPVSFARQGNGFSGIPGSGRPPDAVDIVFDVLGKVVVDDHFQIIDMQPARRDISGN